MSAAAEEIRRFRLNMESIAVGAQVRRSRRAWTIISAKRQDVSVKLVLRHGTKSVRVWVPICHSGPCLADVGLSSLKAAPAQMQLIGGAA
jgi:hypothetical protein